MPPHDRYQLRLANACHPDMDEEQRRAILLAVIEDLHHERWRAMLRRRGAQATVAMRMLGELERPRGSRAPAAAAAEGYHRTPHAWGLAVLWSLFLLLVLLVACRHRLARNARL